MDVLPDSRARDGKGSVLLNGTNYVPIYCCNCGKRYGMVPERYITHVTALCDDGCAGKYGDLAHFYVDSDAPLKANAAEVVSGLTKRLGRPVTAGELDRMAREETSSPLAALYRDWQAHLAKTG